MLKLILPILFLPALSFAESCMYQANDTPKEQMIENHMYDYKVYSCGNLCIAAGHSKNNSHIRQAEGTEYVYFGFNKDAIKAKDGILFRDQLANYVSKRYKISKHRTDFWEEAKRKISERDWQWALWRSERAVYGDSKILALAPYILPNESSDPKYHTTEYNILRAENALSKINDTKLFRKGLDITNQSFFNMTDDTDVGKEKTKVKIKERGFSASFSLKRSLWGRVAAGKKSFKIKLKDSKLSIDLHNYINTKINCTQVR